jgi:hypothetical protein
MTPNTAGPSGNTVVTFCGKATIPFSISTGTAIAAFQVNLAAFSNVRFNELMEMYQLFRFVEIKVRVMAYEPTGINDPTQFCVLAYAPGQATTPTSYTDLIQLNDSICWNNTGASLAGKQFCLSVPRQILMRDSPSKWYRTQPSASLESWEENQGTFFLGLDANVTGNTSYLMQCAYRLQVCGSVTAGMIPAPTLHLDRFADAMRKAFPALSLLDINSNSSSVAGVIARRT